MGDWTRYNPSDGKPYRTFAGADSFGLAWTLGAGASMQLGSSPATLDLTYRLSGYGNVAGGSAPTSDNGATPLEPFNFGLMTHTVTVGLRIPIGG